MTVVGEAFVRVRPDTDQFQKEATEQVGRAAGAAAVDVGRQIQRTVTSGIVGGSVVTALVGTLADADEARRVGEQTSAVIRSTGAAAGVTADDVADLAGELSNLSGVDDELVQQGANLLLTFTNIKNGVGEGNDVFNQATETLLDMSAALGTDASASAVQLGKALNDPIRGITALSRVGVTFTEQQKEQIRTLVESGDTMAAQRIILAELNREFGGSAAAQATDLQRLQTSMGNIREEVGSALAPALGVAERAVSLLVAGFDRLPAFVQTPLVLAAGFVAVARPINETITLLRTLGIASATTAVATTALAAAEEAENAVTVQATATNSAQAVSNLYVAQTSGVAAGAARGLVAALGPLGIMAGLAAGAYALSKGLESVFNESSELADGLRDAAALTDEELVASMERATAAVEMFGRDGLTVFRGLVEENIGTAQRYRDALAAQGEDVTELDAILTDAAGAQRQVNADTAAGAAITGTASAATASYTIRARELITVQEAQEEQARLTGQAVDGLRSALQRAFDSVSSGIEANADFQGSLDDLVETFSGADGLAVSLDTSTEEGRRFLELVVAARDAAGEATVANYEQTRSVESATQAGLVYRDALIEQLTQLGLTRTAAEEYVTQLGLTPEVIRTTVVTNADAVVEDLRRRLVELLDLSNPEGLDNRFGVQRDIPGRAGGGPVSAGSAYLVGERGQELFVPDVSGSILPADQTAGLATRADLVALARGLGGKGAMFRDVIVQGASNPYATAREVVREMRAAAYRADGSLFDQAVPA